MALGTDAVVGGEHGGMPVRMPTDVAYADSHGVGVSIVLGLLSFCHPCSPVGGEVR
jgi:hypothetical protein